MNGQTAYSGGEASDDAPRAEGRERSKAARGHRAARRLFSSSASRALSVPETDAAWTMAAMTAAAEDADPRVVSRSSFLTRFATEILRAQRRGDSLTLVLLDPCDPLDPHAASELAAPVGARPDVALTVALSSHLRGFDLLAHWTDTTLALLLLDSDRAGAAAVLQRLTGVVARPDGTGQRVVLRAGIAAYPRDGRTVHELCERASASLYAPESRAIPSGSTTLDV